MKKLLLTICISFLCLSGKSQTFEGVKLSKNAISFAEQLVKKRGYEYSENENELTIIKGPATLTIEPTMKGGICYLEYNILCESSWNKIRNEFCHQLDSLRKVYGTPVTESTCFSYSFYHHRIDELTGIKRGFCNYYANWRLKNLTIYLSILYISSDNTYTVNVEYINTNNC